MTPPRIRIHLTDGNYFLRLGLESILATSPDVHLEEFTGNGSDAIEAAHRLKPDLVLMESNITNVCSMEATRRIVTMNPATKVVMFSSVHDIETMTRAHLAGACGYLAKSSISTDMGAALRMVNSGTRIFSKPSDADRFPLDTVNNYELQAHFLRLTSPRDRRLLNALAMGHTNIQIAALLHLSEGTVKADLAKIMESLHVTNRVQLAVLVVQAGLLEDECSTTPLTAGPKRHATPRA